jgi:hypothetical protein
VIEDRKNPYLRVFSVEAVKKTLFFDGSARDFPAAKTDERVFAAAGKP